MNGFMQGLLFSQKLWFELQFICHIFELTFVDARLEVIFNTFKRFFYTIGLLPQFIQLGYSKIFTKITDFWEELRSYKQNSGFFKIKMSYKQKS